MNLTKCHFASDSCLESLSQNGFYDFWQSMLFWGCVASLAILFFVFLTFAIFAEKRKFPSRLSLYLSISSFGLVVAILLNTLIGWENLCALPVPPACLAQGFLVQFCASSTVFWWFIICLNLHATVVTKEVHYSFRTEGLYLLLGWGAPLILAIVPLQRERRTLSPAWLGGLTLVPSLGYHYTFSGNFCWIGGSVEWAFGTFYSELILVYLIGFVLFIRVILEIRRLSVISKRGRLTMQGDTPLGLSAIAFKYTRHLLFLFCGFVILMILCISEIVTATMEECDAWRSWFPVVSLVESAQGFFIGSVILFSKQNFDLYRELFHRCFVPPEPEHPLRASMLNDPLIIDDSDYQNRLDSSSSQWSVISSSLPSHSENRLDSGSSPRSNSRFESVSSKLSFASNMQRASTLGAASSSWTSRGGSSGSASQYSSCN